MNDTAKQMTGAALFGLAVALVFSAWFDGNAMGYFAALLIGYFIGADKTGLNLAKSWGDMTEDRVNALLDRMSAGKRAEFGGHIDAERKLAAIRLLREAAGIGLRDAKNAVEWMLAHRAD